MTTTSIAPRLDIAADARPLYRAQVALDRAVRESPRFAERERATWNRLAVSTHMVFEP